MKHVHFLPFVGEHYQSTAPKMLILGESHYIDCGGNGTPEFTQEILKGYLQITPCDYENWMNTFRRFEHALTGKKLNDEERLACWNELAFYNYLQKAMVSPREAGTAQDYKDAEPAFFEVLETLRPDIVIVWGKRLWQNLPWDKWSDGETLVIDGKTVDNGYYTLPDGHRVYILSAIHPAATMFSCNFWHNAIETFKQRVAKKYFFPMETKDEKLSLDPMFADAARLVVAKQDGSATRLQRQFEIGWNRACRLVEQLETAGIVGADQGAKGREVLIQDTSLLEQKLQELRVC